MDARKATKLIAEARARRPAPPSRRELRTAFFTSGIFVAGAASFAAAADWQRPLHPVLAAALIVTFACLTQVEVEIASGFAVPTQLAFVPMLFLLPLSLVPAAVACGYVLGGLIHAARGRAHALRVTSLIGCSWFSLPPAILLAAAGSPAARWHHWPLFLAAFAAQCLGDAAHTTVHERLAHDVRTAQIIPALKSIYAFDLMLTPAGLLAAAVGGFSFLALLPLTVLLTQLAGERRTRHDAELEAVGFAEEARHDSLTGLLNRRAFDAELASLCGPEGTLAHDVVVCMLDLDHFKEFNDANGHAAGDELLRAAAQAWSAELRHNDILARLGGDEFALTLTDHTYEQATQIAERLVTATPLGAGCSIGLTQARDGDRPEELLARADRALYSAKDAGRRRLVSLTTVRSSRR